MSGLPLFALKAALPVQVSDLLVKEKLTKSCRLPAGAVDLPPFGEEEDDTDT